jgi:molybdate transport system substrate-binding protein
MMILILCIGLLTGCSGDTDLTTGNVVDNAVVTSVPTVTNASTATSVPTNTIEPTATIAPANITSLPETEIYVFIAASLNNAMTEIKNLYKQTQPNVNIILNADSSGTLQTQIEEGAECDIFFSAAMKQMTSLVDGGYIEDTSVKNLLENKVVLIKPIGTQTAVTGFENIYEAKNIALAGEDVPVGAYAREIFTNLGIWDRVEKMEINEGANVTAVLAAISEASNEIGVVYATDANSVMDSVEIIAEAPEESLNTPVTYPVGLVKNSEADDAQQNTSKDFLEFLASTEATAVFEEYGFTAYIE